MNSHYLALGVSLNGGKVFRGNYSILRNSAISTDLSAEFNNDLFKVLILSHIFKGVFVTVNYHIPYYLVEESRLTNVTNHGF